MSADDPEIERLRAALADARDAVKAAETENGRLRGELTAMRVDLDRARQDQYHVWRIVLRPALAVRRRLRGVR